MTDIKPCAPSADRNKQVILQALLPLLSDNERIFEFGSGTGQHACHIASALQNIIWQPSELSDKLSGIRQWIADSGCSNILPPVELDLSLQCTSEFVPTMCYSANTLHIVGWKMVEELFRCSASMLSGDGKLIIYGPYKVGGQHTSDGNEAFDEQLRSSDPLSGIRDIAELDELACDVGFLKAEIIDMPANNKLLAWRKPG